MSWGRVDDHLDDDPRWIALPLDGKALWIACLPYSLRADSPRVVRAIAHREAGEDTDRRAALLVESGLWRVTADGWEYATGGFAGWDAIAEPAELQAAIHERRSAAGKASAIARRKKYGSAIPSNAPWNSPPDFSEIEHPEIKDRTHTEQRSNGIEPGPGPGPYPVHSTTSTVRGIATAPARAHAREGDDEPPTAAAGADPSSPLALQLTPTRPRDDGLDRSATHCHQCGKGKLCQRYRKADGHPFVACSDRACNWTADGHLADVVNHPKRRELPGLDPDELAFANALRARASL